MNGQSIAARPRPTSVEIGERELATLAAGDDVEAFLQQHEVLAVDPPVTLDMVPPHAPAQDETWESTIHHFRLHELQLGHVPLGSQLGPASGDIPDHWRPRVTFPHVGPREAPAPAVGSDLD